MLYSELYKRFANPGESPEAFEKRWTTEQQQFKYGDIYVAVGT